MQQMGMAPNGQPIITSQLQPMVSCCLLLSSPPISAYAVLFLCKLLQMEIERTPNKYNRKKTENIVCTHMTSIKCEIEARRGGGRLTLSRSLSRGNCSISRLIWKAFRNSEEQNEKQQQNQKFSFRRYLLRLRFYKYPICFHFNNVYFMHFSFSRRFFALRRLKRAGGSSFGA